MDPLLSRLSDSLASARSLEDLTRPLLEMLEEVTRMESTYLTRIDFQQSLQHVLYARNSRQLEIPEGLAVPWGDTLCRRALQEGRFFTQDVPACWGDSEAAASLGIQTYVSVPVNLSDGVVFGTLCAASSKAAHLPQHAEKVLRLFAKLIAQQVEREQLLQALQQRNAQLTEMALVDSLTGVPNRRALYQELERLLAWARRSGRSVMVAYVDLDDFKPINDQYGHEAGDALLCAVARQLQAVCRESDYLARMGGRRIRVHRPGPGHRSGRHRGHCRPAPAAGTRDSLPCGAAIGRQAGLPRRQHRRGVPGSHQLHCRYGAAARRCGDVRGQEAAAQMTPLNGGNVNRAVAQKVPPLRRTREIAASARRQTWSRSGRCCARWGCTRPARKSRSG